MTSTLLAGFLRVSKRFPCPVCERPDWCLISRDDPAAPSRAICKRMASSRPWGDAGFLHELRLEVYRRHRHHRAFSIDLSRSGVTVFDSIVRDAIRSIHHTQVDALAARLSVTPDSLVRLGVGWIEPYTLIELGTRSRAGAWSFPMRDHVGCICGVRLRSASGFKFAITGSRNGLFIPTTTTGPLNELLVAEGESDTAALFDLGFQAVGKPGAGSADEMTFRYVGSMRPRSVVVVADNDSIGRSRAQSLASRLSSIHRHVRIIAPPIGVKDVREWKKSGADAATIASTIAATAPVGLVISITKGRI